MSSTPDLPTNPHSETTGLHSAAFMPDLLVAALARHADKPAVYLGDEVLTAVAGRRRDEPVRPGVRLARHR